MITRKYIYLFTIDKIMFSNVHLRHYKSLQRLVIFIILTLLLTFLYVSFSWINTFENIFCVVVKGYKENQIRQSNSQFASDWCRLQRWRVGWRDMLRPCTGKMSWEQRDIKSRKRTDANKSYVSIWDLQPPGHFSRIWIQSVDIDGQKKTFGGDSWRVYIRQGPASLAPVVIDHDTGLYEVLVLVPEPGTYSAQIVLDHTLCDGLREPPENWFANGRVQKGTDFGTYIKPKRRILGYIGEDYIMKKLMDKRHHSFTIQGTDATIFPWQHHQYTECGVRRCDWLWDGHGYWRKKQWILYHSNSIPTDRQQKLKRAGTLWIYGDSLGYRFVESARTRPICTEIFEHCNYTYNWIYEVKDKKHPLRLTTDFNKTIILNKLRSILESPEMTNSNSVLILSFGIHFPISLTFKMYKDLLDSAVELLKETVGKSDARRYVATVIWKSTASFERQKVNRVPWPRKQLNYTMFRFMTTQRNQLFHAYALSAMCNAGIPVLDVFPLTAAFSNGTLDYVHYVDRVFFPAEKAIQSFVTRKRKYKTVN